MFEKESYAKIRNEKLINSSTEINNVANKNINNDYRILNIVFALMVVIGQVGENVVLPIWFASLTENHSVDPLWILLFNSLFCLVVFAILVLIFDKNQITFHQHLCNKKLITRYGIIGIANAFGGLLIVFSARKCAPYLQAILGTFSIFWVMLLRFILIGKAPNKLQFIYSCIIFFALFLTSIPSIFGFNDSNAFQTKTDNSIWKILWPLLFASGSAPGAIVYVITESVVKNNHDGYSVSIWWLLLMQTMFQCVVWVTFFWVDSLPIFGATSSIHGIFYNLKTDWSYFLMLDTSNFKCMYLPMVWNILFAIQTIGYTFICRYNHASSSWVAVVNCLVTPLGAMFWYLFKLDNNGWFGWQPHWNGYDLYALCGLILMIPFVYLYNVETSAQKHKKLIVNTDL
eukprot:59968_1